MLKSKEKVMSTPVSDYFGCTRTEGPLFGVEIEMEFPENFDLSPLNEIPRRNWLREEDGSLRGQSVEFVQTSPGPLEKTTSLVEALYSVTGEDNINNAQRAGTHVHINFSDKTIGDLFNFAEYWYALEPLLVRYGGNSRVGNHFCLRAIDAEELIFPLVQLRKGRRFEFNDDFRYSALNWCALNKYGTLETRSCGTFGSQHLTDFLRILDEMYRLSLAEYQPAFRLYSGHTEEEMVLSLLPNTGYLLTPFLSEEQVLEDFHTSIRFLQYAFLIN